LAGKGHVISVQFVEYFGKVIAPLIVRAERLSEALFNAALLVVPSKGGLSILIIPKEARLNCCGWHRAVRPVQRRSRKLACSCAYFLSLKVICGGRHL
jgi:hypothetical protein